MSVLLILAAGGAVRLALVGLGVVLLVTRDRGPRGGEG